MRVSNSPRGAAEEEVEVDKVAAVGPPVRAVAAVEAAVGEEAHPDYRTMREALVAPAD